MKTITLKRYRKYNASEIMPLYEAVGWSNYTERPDMLKAAYESSLCVLAAYVGDRVVGVIRAVGDKASILYVQDIIVLPEYQRRGIGTRMVKKLFELYSDCYQKVLLTDSVGATESFYRSVGLYPAKEFGCMAYFRTY